MAIIRSKIARQLLAEGGAPRKPFANGGFDYESAAAFGSDVDDFGMDFVDSDESAGGGDVNFTPQGPSIIDRIGTRIDDTRDALTRRGINRNMMSTRDAILSLNPFASKTNMNLFDVYQTMMDPNQAIFSEGLTGTRLDMDRAKQTFDSLKKEGVDVTKDIGPQLDNLTQAQISNIFNMNRPTPVSDSAPMLPKLPRIAKVPSDVEQQKSDLGEFIANIRGANPTAFNIPERFRLAEGGEPRQEYGLGSIVKKITGAVKKVAKSPIGKAAILGATLIPFGTANQSLFTRAFGALPFNVADIPGGKVTAGIVGTSLLGGLLASKEPEQDINALSQRISDQTGIDVSKIRREVQQAYQNKDTSSLAQKYPFLVDQEYSASFAKGGRIGFENGGSYKDFEEFMMKRGEAMKEFNRNKILEEFQKYMKSKDPTVEAAVGGKIEDTPKKEGIMRASNIENERILENLLEKYVDMGLSPKDAEKAAFDEFERMSRKQSMDRTMAAEGGMMDLGGNEMDLRGGGFVPIGAREKADDVPARLSKNEFVFTADAVRAAGGGSVDRGADLMYKTMKQLENKVV